MIHHIAVENCTSTAQLLQINHTNTPRYLTTKLSQTTSSLLPSQVPQIKPTNYAKTVNKVFCNSHIHKKSVCLSVCRSAALTCLFCLSTFIKHTQLHMHQLHNTNTNKKSVLVLCTANNINLTFPQTENKTLYWTGSETSSYMSCNVMSVTA